MALVKSHQTKLEQIGFMQTSYYAVSTIVTSLESLY